MISDYFNTEEFSQVKARVENWNNLSYFRKLFYLLFGNEKRLRPTGAEMNLYCYYFLEVAKHDKQ